MKSKQQKTETVMGHTMPPAKITGMGIALGLLYVGLPFLGALAVLDLALYLFFRFALDSCYGVLCLL